MRLGAAATLSVMLLFVKLATQAGVSLAETIFWRQIPTVPILLLWFAAQGQLRTLKSARLKAHAGRSLTGLIGLTLNFSAVMLLPLAEFTTLNFTSAIWAVLLSALVLKENVGPWRWGAVVLGFCGVLVIAQPGNGHLPLLGAAAALGAAFMIAIISIQIRDLARTEHPLTIVFWFAMFSALPLACAMPFLIEGYTGRQVVLLAGVAGFGLVGQFLLTAALRYGAVASVIVMDYSSLLWATLLGWWVLGSLPPQSTWMGAPLIVGAGLLIAWREHRLAIERARVAIGE